MTIPSIKPFSLSVCPLLTLLFSQLLILFTVLHSFPMLYTERADALAAEERDARLDTPIFVCQLSFPGMPTLLHFFEPR